MAQVPELTIPVQAVIDYKAVEAEAEKRIRQIIREEVAAIAVDAGYFLESYDCAAVALERLAHYAEVRR